LSQIRGGSVEWSGRHLVNPWKDGKLVDLDSYPKLAAYYDEHRLRVRGRHVSKARPSTWYRTIDRVDPELLDRDKLLLPDMKAAAHPVLDVGAHYPHHNLYYVVSDTWDLEVLGGILLSDIANLFVGAYCVKMRGDTYRFQAQYLRKIRVPDPSQISKDDASELRQAFRERNGRRASDAAAAVYGIERSALILSREIDIAIGGHETEAAAVDGRSKRLERKRV
jgi:adenine-specific DNA-methyltransferase